MRSALPLVCLLAATGCGPRRELLPDYAEMMVVGVDPTEEAQNVVAALGAAEFTEDERAEGDGWIALGFHRERDGHRALRIVTRRGVVFALDSGALDPDAPLGEVHLRPETGSDVDGDGRLDVLVARREAERECLLVLALTDDGGLDALRVDATDLPADACLEAFEDVDGHTGLEAIVRIRVPALRRDRTPTADVPLERDADGAYGRRPPAVAFLARRRADLAASLEAARAAADLDETLVLAVEAALVAREAGESAVLQLDAFDAAVGAVVWTEAHAAHVRRAREHIAHGWR